MPVGAVPPVSISETDRSTTVPVNGTNDPAQRTVAATAELAASASPTATDDDARRPTDSSSSEGARS
jgi:hypothetical protein